MIAVNETVPLGSGSVCSATDLADIRDAFCQANLAATCDSLDRLGRTLYLGFMNVDLTQDQRAFIRRAIESGRLQSEDEAVQEALSLWEGRERGRAECLAALDEAEASLARGEGRPITPESMTAFAEEVKQRGRRRLAADSSPSR